jgi:UDP-2-acetamido-3-amino-2,3-dideoxy-glucuronate N-acetyltransferase
MPDAPAPRPAALIHPHAVCESARIGPGTRIWAFAHVLPGATIGADCNICDHVFIENDVVVGDRVTIKSGVQLWDGLRVADDVFIGPNATFSNDKFPRSKQHLKAPEQTHLGPGASIGAGAVLLPGLRIGSHAMVGAGAVVTHDVPAKAIVSGNPARIVGYVDAHRRAAAAGTQANATSGSSAVRGVRLQQMKLVEDLRGRLSVGEVGNDLPFAPQRYFMVFDVPGKDVRGEHAHRECAQFLICARGSVTVVVDDGLASEEVVLDRPDLGLYVPPMVWAVQYRYSPDALLFVLASHPYDAGDYIRDYEEFLSLVTASPQ